MQRIRSLDPQDAHGRTQELLTTVERAFGMVPNVAKVMANSPAVLEGFLALSTAMGRATIGDKLHHQIKLTASETNACAYCTAMLCASAALHDQRRLAVSRGVVGDRTAPVVQPTSWGDRMFDTDSLSSSRFSSDANAHPREPTRCLRMCYRACACACACVTWVDRVGSRWSFVSPCPTRAKRQRDPEIIALVVRWFALVGWARCHWIMPFKAMPW